MILLNFNDILTQNPLNIKNIKKKDDFSSFSII